MQTKTLLEAQTELQQLGLYHGRPDGRAGPLTKAAIRAFQRLHKLDDDGILGRKTLAELFPPINPDREALGDGAKTPSIVIPIWPAQKDVARYYGEVGKHQTEIKLPYPMWLAWDLRKKVSKFAIHERVHDSALRAFNKILSHYGLEGIDKWNLDVWGGCLNVRKMRGGTQYSMHSWGIAIDFDPENNQLRWGRDRAMLAKEECKEFWRIWASEGWVGLGPARNYDWMHVQAARI